MMAGKEKKVGKKRKEKKKVQMNPLYFCRAVCGSTESSRTMKVMQKKSVCGTSQRWGTRPNSSNRNVFPFNITKLILSYLVLQ